MISLDHYRLLGRSGLRVSPLALGTMTFGKDWGLDRLNGASAPPPILPERFVVRPTVQQLIFGGATVETRR